MKNKALTAALAAVIAASSLGVASAAEAQSRHDRGDRYEQRHDRGDRYDRRHDRNDRYDRRHHRNDRYDRRDERRSDARYDRRYAQQQRAMLQRQRQIQQQHRLQQQQRAYARMMAQRRYSAGAYQRPYGYQQRHWQAGYTLPPSYRHSRYAVDHRRYGLRAPPYGYQYSRVDNDVVLTAIATGLITSVIVGLFQ